MPYMSNVTLYLSPSSRGSVEFLQFCTHKKVTFLWTTCLLSQLAYFLILSHGQNNTGAVCVCNPAGRFTVAAKSYTQHQLSSMFDGVCSQRKQTSSKTLIRRTRKLGEFGHYLCPTDGVTLQTYSTHQHAHILSFIHNYIIRWVYVR